MDDLAAPDGPVGKRRRGKRALWWLLGATLLLSGSVVAALTTADRLASADGTTELEGRAKHFRLDEVRSGRRPVRLRDFAGKPVVLNFFGSWCPPCLREMPDMQAVYERYGGAVAFVGVTFQDTRERAATVLEETGVTYPSAFDPDDRVALAYELNRMPTTIFISPSGEMLERAEGELSEPQLTSIIERLFDMPAPPAN